MTGRLAKPAARNRSGQFPKRQDMESEQLLQVRLRFFDGLVALDGWALG